MLQLGIPLIALGLSIYAFSLKNRARRECYRVASSTCSECKRSTRKSKNTKESC